METRGRVLLFIAVTLVVPGFEWVTVPTLAQPYTNDSLSFDGTSSKVVVPNNSLFELTDGTIELWFKPDWDPGSLAYNPVLIANRQGALLTRYSIAVDRDLAGVSLANGTSVSSVPYAFTRGEWYHLALVESGSVAQVFVNGQYIGSTAYGFGTLIGLPLNLGSDGVSQFFRGQIDEIRIWNVARSPTELRYNLSRALAGTEPGLVAYWRMDEGLGATATDATTNRLDGAVFGATWTASGVVLVNTSGSLGLALDLAAGRSNYVQVAASPSLALTNQFTFEAWIRPRSAQCNTILSRGDGANLAATDYIFQVGSDGANCGVMKLALMAGGGWTTSASSLPLNAWAHVAVTCDGATNRFYINGILDRAIAAAGTVFQSGSPLFIGRQGTAGLNYFDGTLDEVRVWNVARSAAEIRANVNQSVPRNSPRLVGYWRFNEKAGVRAVDSSASAIHGMLINRPLRSQSFWCPFINLTPGNPQTHECHVSFESPVGTIEGGPVIVAGGVFHSLAVKADGTIDGWGRNDFGQTDPPAGLANCIAVTGSETFSLALKADGSIVGWGNPLFLPINQTNAVAMVRGYFHSLALKQDGAVVGWGDNTFGQTNVPPSATNVVAIAACANSSLALRADGTVVGWGNNDYGQTNIPSNLSSVVALAGGIAHCLALKADGTVRGWGRNDVGQTTVPTSATEVVAIDAGSDYSLALRADGSVISWGNSGNGERNIPAGATNLIDIAAGGYHGLAVRADGLVLAWGMNNYAQVNVPSAIRLLNSPLTIRGSVNTDVPGTYVLTYVATNAVGAVAIATRTVKVQDTTAPGLSLVGPNPLRLDVGATFSDPGATALDACTGDLTASILRTGSVNTSVPGAYTLNYTVTDPAGNSATTNRVVLVGGVPGILGFTAFLSGTNAVTGSPVVQFLADVNPNGLATVTFAQYGLTTSYPGRTPAVNLPASYNTSTFFATLDGLIPGATYHFRIGASNSLGQVYGPDQTFTVPAIFLAGDLNGDGRVGPAELDGVFSNYWQTGGSVVLTNPASLGGGAFQLGLTNLNGLTFSVYASTNLTDWELLPSPALPVLQFLDPAATNSPQRFYRIQFP